MIRITRSPFGAMADAFLTTATKSASPVVANAVVPGAGDAMNLFGAAASWKQASDACMASAGTQAQRDNCSKSGWAGELEYVCGAATTAAGQPEAALLCSPIASVVADITFRLAELIAAGTAALIPSAWQAQGVFCASCLEAQVYAPIPERWKAAVASVQAAWKSATEAAGLPGKPFAIQRKWLLPPGTDLGQNGFVVMSVGKEAAKKLGEQEMASYATSAEESLLYWLRYATNAWSDQTVWTHSGPSTHGDAQVWSSTVPGPVAPLDQGNCASEQLCSTGPFGAGSGGFPRRCDGDCQAAMVSFLNAHYKQRLAALRRALPAVSGAIALQVNALKNPLAVAPKLKLSLVPTFTVAPIKKVMPAPAAPAKKAAPAWAWWAGGGLLAALVVGGVWYARTQHA